MTPEFLLFGLNLDARAVTVARSIADQRGFEPDALVTLDRAISVGPRRFEAGTRLPIWSRYYGRAVTDLASLEPPP